MNIVLPKNAKQIFIEGTVGKLDCLILTPLTNKPIGSAIIFHPDPKNGGTYTNKIVQTIAKVLTQNGYLCICPNLRGVGLSQGIHDFGNGEKEDANSIYNYLKTNHPNLPIIFAGFSFGCSLASYLATTNEYKLLILIGSAVTRYTININNPDKTLVIHGIDDDVIPINPIIDWANKFNQTITLVPYAGHFFHGKLNILYTLINNFIQSTH